MQEQQETRREERPVQGGMYCPACGRPGWAPRRPWGMRPAGPWGAHTHHPGHWIHGPTAAVWAGIVPAVLGFALGYLVASARMATYAVAREEKRKR